MISTVSHSKSCLYFHDLAVFLCWLHKNVSCRIADTDLHHIRLIAFEAHQDFMTFRSFFKFQNKRKTQLIFTVHPPWTLMEHFSIQLRGPGLPTALHRRRVSTKTQEYQKATCLKTFLEMFKFFWKKKKYSTRKWAYLISPEKCWFGSDDFPFEMVPQKGDMLIFFGAGTTPPAELELPVAVDVTSTFWLKVTYLLKNICDPNVWVLGDGRSSYTVGLLSLTWRIQGNGVQNFLFFKSPSSPKYKKIKLPFNSRNLILSMITLTSWKA